MRPWTPGGVNRQGIGAGGRVFDYDIYRLKRHWSWNGCYSRGFPWHHRLNSRGGFNLKSPWKEIKTCDLKQIYPELCTSSISVSKAANLPGYLLSDIKRRSLSSLLGRIPRKKGALLLVSERQSSVAAIGNGGWRQRSMISVVTFVWPLPKSPA